MSATAVGGFPSGGLGDRKWPITIQDDKAYLEDGTQTGQAPAYDGLFETEADDVLASRLDYAAADEEHLPTKALVTRSRGVISKNSLAKNLLCFGADRT